MAITLDTTTDLGAMTATPITAAHTVGVGSNKLLEVRVAFYHADTLPTITGITYNGVALTQLVTEVTSAGTVRADIWYLANPAEGEHDVVITFSSTPSAGRAIATSWFGVNQSPSFRSSNSAAATSDTPTVDVTSISGDMVVDATGNAAATLTTAGAGQTEQYRSGGTGMSYETASGVSTTMSWTLVASTSWVIVGGSIIPLEITTTSTTTTTTSTTTTTTSTSTTTTTTSTSSSTSTTTTTTSTSSSTSTTTTTTSTSTSTTITTTSTSTSTTTTTTSTSTSSSSSTSTSTTTTTTSTSTTSTTTSTSTSTTTTTTSTSTSTTTTVMGNYKFTVEDIEKKHIGVDQEKMRIGIDLY